MTETANALENVLGAKVTAAFSSLTTFSCELDNGKGLMIEAVEGTSGGAGISVQVVDAAQLPREMDAVCQVDWTWIYGSAVQRFATTAGAAKFDLNDAGPLTVSVQLWQGKPFLAFQPFRAPK
jgi:hypothetical protein